MKKFIAIAMAAALSLTMLAGCGGTGDKDKDKDKNEKNEAPVITGVPMEAQGMVGEEFDALKGVTATDAEDGDLTDQIKVSAEGLTFSGGKTTPAEASLLGYEIIYTVTDSDGETTTEYCTFKVKEGAGELVNVYTADFSDVTPKYDWAEGNEGEGHNHWWTPTIETATGTAALKEGKLEFDITALNDAPDGDVRLARTFGSDVIVPGTYKFVIWASSTVETYVHLIALDKKAEQWTTPGGKWNVKVGTEMAAYSTDEFTIPEGGTDSLEFRIHMGKITPNPDNPADTSASAFKLSIEKIAILRTTGKDVETDTFKKETITSASDLGLTVTNQGDGAAAASAYDDTEKAAKIDITKYNNPGGIWSISTAFPLTGAAVEKDVRYGYEIVMKATHACKAEIMVAPKDNKEASNRFVQYNVQIGEEYTTIRSEFKASEETVIAEPGIHFQIGKTDGIPAEDSNAIYIKSVRFFTITGDKDTTNMMDKFILFGEASPDKTSAKYPIKISNQSDEDIGSAAMGTAYFKDNKLVYEIHQGGSDSGHNKIAIGYWDNPIKLPANAYYVVSLKIKASVAIDFNLTLHDMTRGWDAAAGDFFIRLMDFDDKALHIGTEETTIEVTSEYASDAACDKCELLLEFGNSLGTNKNVKIEISEIKIGYRTVQA